MSLILIASSRDMESSLFVRQKTVWTANGAAFSPFSAQLALSSKSYLVVYVFCTECQDSIYFRRSSLVSFSDRRYVSFTSFIVSLHRATGVTALQRSFVYAWCLLVLVLTSFVCVLVTLEVVGVSITAAALASTSLSLLSAMPYT